MAKTRQTVLLPGEFIATEEEFASGRNSFSENGSIKASIMGIADFNDSSKEVAVKGKSTQTIQEGDIVYGKVVLVKESTVVLELVSAEGGKKVTQKSAQIPVRNVSTQYVDDLKKLFKIGDIVKARAVMVSPLAIDIATNEKGLGIVKAYCSKCRSEMNYSNGKLMCLNCGNVEERRWFEDEQLPRQGFGGGRGGFGERRSFGGRGGGRSGGGFDRREGRGSFGGGRGFGGSRGPDGGRRGFGGRSGGRGSFGRRENDRGEFGHGRGERRNFSGRREGDRGNFGSGNRRRN